MRGVAEQSDPAEAPPRQRVLIDHRKFQNGVGVAHHVGHVQPIEVPVGDAVDEILEPAGTVPVALGLVVGRLDIEDPIDELAAFGVDIVADRIDQNLGDVEPADAHHAGAGEVGLPARDAAPHIDAGIARRAFVRIELLANHRVDAFATDDHVAALRRQRFLREGMLEVGRGAAGVLVHANAFVACDDAIGSGAFPEGIEQHHLQIAAMNARIAGIRSRQSGLKDLCK